MGYFCVVYEALNLKRFKQINTFVWISAMIEVQAKWTLKIRGNFPKLRGWLHIGLQLNLPNSEQVLRYNPTVIISFRFITIYSEPSESSQYPGLKLVP